MNEIEAIPRRRLNTLIAMHRFRRPHLSGSEAEFIRIFIDPLPRITNGRARLAVDGFGNRIVRVGESSILWSCHTDTVHRTDGMQSLYITKAGVIGVADKKQHRECLGADDGAGCFIAREMILAGKPGLYVFHRGEERGGLGSAWIEKNTPELLKDIKAAIAFDRKGTKDIIIEQSRGVCASEACAASLEDMLKLGMEKSRFGSFTDTANYRKHVPECLNLSVGYYDAHSGSETLSSEFVFAMADAMIARFDEAKLVVERDHTAPDPVKTYGYYHGPKLTNEQWKQINELYRNTPMTWFQAEDHVVQGHCAKGVWNPCKECEGKHPDWYGKLYDEAKKKAQAKPKAKAAPVHDLSYWHKRDHKKMGRCDPNFVHPGPCSECWTKYPDDWKELRRQETYRKEIQQHLIGLPKPQPDDGGIIASTGIVREALATKRARARKKLERREKFERMLAAVKKSHAAVFALLGNNGWNEQDLDHIKHDSSMKIAGMLFEVGFEPEDVERYLPKAKDAEHVLH